MPYHNLPTKIQNRLFYRCHRHATEKAINQQSNSISHRLNTILYIVYFHTLLVEKSNDFFFDAQSLQLIRLT